MKVFHDMSACPSTKLPKNPTDVKVILTVFVKAEICAVRRYTNICNMIAGKDHRIYDLAQSILNEEIEHESLNSWAKALLNILCVEASIHCLSRNS